MTSWTALLWVTLAAGAAGAADVGPIAPGAAEAGKGAGGSEVTDGSGGEAGLAREIHLLERLVAGAPSGDLSVASLFEVDLRDEAAVQSRLATLRSQIAALEARLAAAEAAAPPAGGGAATEADGGTPRAVTAASGSGDIGALLRRQRLRLEILSLPAEARRALLAESERRRQMAAEQQASVKKQAELEAAEREAEQARRQALESARLAASQEEEALANERARMLAALEASSNLRGELAKEQGTQAEQAVQWLEQQRSLGQQVRTQASAKEQVALYEQLATLLTQRREQLRIALGELDSPSRLTPFSPQVDLAAHAPQALTGEFQPLLSRVRESEVLLRAEEQRLRFSRASAIAHDVEVLNRLRLELLSRLPEEKRSELLGVSKEGLLQLQREVEQLILMARWYPRDRLASVRSLSSLWADFVILGLAGWAAVRLLLLLGGGLYARKRWRGWVESLRAAGLRRLHSDTLGVLLDRWSRAVLALGGGVGLLLWLYLFFSLLRAQEVAELQFLRDLALGYGWYALAITTTHSLLTSAATTQRAEISPELSGKILRSIRLVGRFALVVVVLLAVSQRILGRGYLYQLVVDFFWVGAFPLVLVLLRAWRADIVRAYLSIYPKGRLAGLVHATREKGSGLGVAALAGVVLMGHGLAVYLQDGLLRFDQTRKALAFLFRRRLERHAETVGRGSVDVSQLPAPLREAFTEEPAQPEWLIARFPHLDEVLERLERWRQGAPGAAYALVGERGIGKTSWLKELSRRFSGVEVVHLTLEQRLLSPAAVAQAFGERLGLGAVSLQELVQALREGPPRLLLVDHCQNLVLRAVNGLAGYEAFAQLVVQACPRTPMVCAFSRYAFEYLEAVTQGRNIFKSVIRLDGWREEEIGELIDKRMEIAGYQASYQDLVVDRVDGTGFASEVIRTGERYRRLLWDYADGNPRLAVHFWLRSLVPDGARRARVRLFQAPSADELESLEEQSRFVLAAVVTHENISVEEAERVLRFPRHQIASTLEYLQAQGYLQPEHGRIRVTSHWNRAVIRYLRRKHLLYS